MSISTTHINVTDYSERQKRTALRILDTLDRGESRLSEHYEKERNHSRTGIRKVINIRIRRDGAEPDSFTVFMRNVSSGGAAFIYPGELETDELMIGIPIPGRDDSWFQGKVVRRKEYLEEGYWDYGVKFTERLM